MKIFRHLTLCFAGLVLILMVAVPRLTATEFINIKEPFIRKIPIAIPVFKSLDGDQSQVRIKTDTTNLLTGILEFTGYFKVLDRSSFLETPQKTGVLASEITFQNWRTINAEWLITGGISQRNDQLIFELRLMDTIKEKVVVGKKYKGPLSDRRKIMLMFASEIVLFLTGKQGVFNSKIAFESTATKNKEIFVCDFDGANPTRITYHNSITLSPSWSSDGRWMAYTSYKNNNPDIFIEHLKDKRNAIISKKGMNMSPSWRPGRFSLAASLSFSGDSEIYLLTGTGKIIRRLTNNWGIDVSPTWSPDGKKLAFVSNRSGAPQIYIKDIISNSVERLTFDGNYNTDPSWSPRGDTIAYASLKNGHFNIYTIKLDGREPRQLTTDTGNNESPSWSPDGSLIVFSSTRTGRSLLYVMTAIGTDQRKILDLPGEQTNPEWSPGGIIY